MGFAIKSISYFPSYLIGQESVPLLLKSRAVCPCHHKVLNEDGYSTQDKGDEKVQVNVVSSAMQVPVNKIITE